jgi:hypothetical protein
MGLASEAQLETCFESGPQILVTSDDELVGVGKS